MHCVFDKFHSQTIGVGDPNSAKEMVQQWQARLIDDNIG